MCLCNIESEPIPECLKVFDSREAYPGEDITLSVVAVGQNFGTSGGFVNAQLLLSNDSVWANVGGQQQYQVVEPHSCNNLTYTVNAQAGVVILVLTTEIQLVQRYSSEKEVNDSISDYIQNNHSFVPQSLLNFPVYINITFNHCPSGFKLSAAQTCVCYPRLLEVDGVKCHISRRELERSGTVWIGNKSASSAVVSFSRYCPYNYCKHAKVNIFDSTDEQCQWDHTGVLCGACPKGKSLTLGTSQCITCSNKNLYLLTLFAAAGVALVVFFKVTDLTTAGGLINGLVFYSNLVKAGCYTYFPSNVIYLTPFQVFIDWLNLDFGIELCFFDGLDGYWKTWLQFVFPLYLWVIALLMILLARYSIKMARLLGNNSVPVLATLFTLSYAKLFRVIITAMKFTVLEDTDGYKYTVWSYDGSIAYFGLQHSILLLVAASVLLVLWLPYTCVLLFAQYLQRCRMWKISRIVSKMQPLIDAHCGPFRDKYRYWFGGLLVARAIPLLVGVVSSTNADQNTVVSTIVMVGVLLLLLNRVYRKFYVYLSEVVLLNLLFLAGFTLYAQTVGRPQHHQAIFTAVSTGFAFFHFVILVLFSTINNLTKFRFQRKWISLHSNICTPENDSYEYERVSD